MSSDVACGLGRRWRVRATAAALCAGAWLAATTASAATQVVSPSDDTFINSINPDNNNGGSASFFTGLDGHLGVMRGLVRFDMPAGLQGRVTVTNVQLQLTLQALGDGTAGTAAVESLQAVTQAWVQGNGVGSVTTTFTVGQACGGSITGATWDQANCTTSTNWTTTGGSVTSTVSGQASTSGVPVGGQVTWDSATNAGMNGDVQSWIDSPAGNHGWRITSSTEGGQQGQAQRFFSTEAGTSVPTLRITYSCKPGFQASGNACVAIASVPAVGPLATGLLGLLLCAFPLLSQRRPGVGRALVCSR
jgi:hypothetical protein